MDINDIAQAFGDFDPLDFAFPFDPMSSSATTDNDNKDPSLDTSPRCPDMPYGLGSSSMASADTARNPNLDTAFDLAIDPNFFVNPPHIPSSNRQPLNRWSPVLHTEEERQERDCLKASTTPPSHNNNRFGFDPPGSNVHGVHSSPLASFASQVLPGNNAPAVLSTQRMSSSTNNAAMTLDTNVTDPVQYWKSFNTGQGSPPNADHFWPYYVDKYGLQVPFPINFVNLAKGAPIRRFHVDEPDYYYNIGHREGYNIGRREGYSIGHREGQQFMMDSMQKRMKSEGWEITRISHTVGTVGPRALLEPAGRAVSAAAKRSAPKPCFICKGTGEIPGEDSEGNAKMDVCVFCKGTKIEMESHGGTSGTPKKPQAKRPKPELLLPTADTGTSQPLKKRRTLRSQTAIAKKPETGLEEDATCSD
ncbi:hypothetical protein MMC13_000210 [Lambiella insularis]|nr:hypothetical protein [Lambiella insularis]